MGQYRWVFVVLLLFAGCDLLPSRSENPEASRLVPLNVGNEWIIRTSLTDAQSGQEVQPATVDTVRVIGDTLISDEQWFQVNVSEGRYLATNRDDGYWTTLPPELGEFDPVRRYKYPAAVGDTFTRPGWPEPATIEVVSLDTTVTVDAGTFRSTHYAQTWEVAGKSQRCDFFVAPGVGLVKKVLPWVDGQSGEIQHTEVEELLEFQLQ